MTTKVNQITGEIEMPEGENFTERDAVQAMRGYDAISSEIKPLEKAKAAAGKIVKEYLGRQYPGAVLRDGETQLEAYLQARIGADTFDLRTAAQDWPGVIVWAAEQGLLKMETKAFDAVAGCAEKDQLAKYRMPGGQTAALVIQRRK